ncbi:hypothetical protein LTR04_002567, partial [Oleoguttula sp. CCFEE 6159]
IDATPTGNPSLASQDPFAKQREATNDPFGGDKLSALAGGDDMRMGSSPPRDRRMSKEWDAAKVPPSRFQKREGSIFSTPGGRDGHVKGSSRDQAYHDKLKEKVRNLEESIKIPDLIEALHELFDEYGTVIDLVAKKNLRAKGQAFVVFDSIEGATKAIDEVQGFELFGKGMQLDYAKTRSDAIVKRQGGEEEFEAHKRRRLAEKGMTPSHSDPKLSVLSTVTAIVLTLLIPERKQALAATEVAKKLKRPAPGPEPPTAAKPAKAARGAGLKSTGGAGGIVPDEYLPPNKILFVRELPEDYDVEALSAIFERFPGFKEVRLVPGRKGIAFVEYEAEDGAISAKEATAGMVLGEQAITVTYQRQ